MGKLKGFADIARRLSREMGWIEPSDRMPPEGLEVLIEVSGYCKSDITMLNGYSYWCKNAEGMKSEEQRTM